MKYTDIKQVASDKYTELSEEVGLFWAFSNEQFAEGKKKYPVNRCVMTRPEQHLAFCTAHNEPVANVTAEQCPKQEKYTSIGAGGYLPSKNVQAWIDGQKAIEKWRKQAVKQAKSEEVILYELNNYECFYTGSIEDAMDVLKDNYTEEEVKAVYHKNKQFAIN